MDFTDVYASFPFGGGTYLEDHISVAKRDEDFGQDEEDSDEDESGITPAKKVEKAKWSSEEVI